MAEPVLATRGLSRHFGSKVAVDALDLEIQEAEIYGFLGPNGSGKTTTIRMLCGLLEPSAGSATVLGLEIPRQAEALRQKIGYMTQRFSLYGDLSVQENLEFIDRIYSLPRRDRRARIDAMIERYELDELRSQRAGTMSGGQRQRLALAAATLHSPPLLFLDEPTSAVDPESRRRFWASLFELAAHGTTILVSTHYMDEAERCHRLAILDEGRLAAEGSPTKLKAALGHSVIEVEAPNLESVRRALEGQATVTGLTQLGARLRILSSEQPELALASAQRALQDLQACVRIVEPSLEDVFVVATR